MKLIVALAGATLAALTATACGSGESDKPEPAMTDRDYTYAVHREVYGKDPAESSRLSDDAVTVQRVTDGAKATCSVIDDLVRVGDLSDAADPTANAEILDPIVRDEAKAYGRTEDQVRHWYVLGATYECNDHVEMLNSYARYSRALGN
ncbi:hypothetical protein GS485_11290 [Rhodococcus hoagii]|nr:hypothetical protein [Prescottella equi]